jgi:DNA repair exonuclease SbcCD ATPase subunit
MPRIRRLEVQGFRGIRQGVALLFEGKSLLLFGENGTGKSSFVDALERLLGGRVSTLDGRAQSLSSERHGPHIRNGGYPVQVSITFDDAGASVFSLGSDPATFPGAIREYLNAACENLYILRRRQILDFIESQPRQRYELLRPFVPLSGIETIEEALRQAREKTQAQVQNAAQEVRRLAQDLRRLLGNDTLPEEPTEEDVIRAINRNLASVGQAEITAVPQLSESIARLSAGLAPFGDLSRQSQLANAIQALEELAEVIPRVQATSVVTSLATLRSREAREASIFYEAVLEQGVRWIGEESRSICPLCEQAIDVQRVVARAQERLHAMHEILDFRQGARRQVESARQAVRSALEAAQRAETRLRPLAEEERDRAQEAVAAARKILDALGEALRGDPPVVDVETLRRHSAQVGADGPLVEALNRCRDEFRARLTSLPSPQAAQKFLSMRERLERLSQIWPQVCQARVSAREAEKQAKAAQTIYEDAQAARKEEVQSLFDELSKEINDIYVRLHPDESHGGVRLEVREAVQGSVNLRADFYDRQGEDPRAYYSDAHLDTLGLAIFLALRRWYRRQRPEFDLVVLDDVLTSVDTAHAVRLSELLLSDFRDYQILLTTHDRIWFEHLRDIQARCGVSQTFVNKVIHKWTIEEGPDLREPEDERQALDRLITDGSSEQIAVMAGRLLEHILQEMRYALRLSVQAKRGEQYEIGELWPAFYAAVKRDYPTLYGETRETLDALDVRWPVRNWVGAHWNIWARNVSRNVAIEFARAVRDLFDRVFCTICRRFIAPSATPLGQLACRCGARIYPAPGREAVQPKSRQDLVRDTRGAFRDARLDTAQYFQWKRAEAGRER